MTLKKYLKLKVRCYILDEKVVGLEDINKAFLDLEKRLSWENVTKSDTGNNIFVITIFAHLFYVYFFHLSVGNDIHYLVSPLLVLRLALNMSFSLEAFFVYCYCLYNVLR